MVTYFSDNQHIIAVDIKTGIGEGRYKNCGHLYINPQGYEFFTACKQQSLVQYHSHQQDVSTCPQNCHFFLDRATAEKERRKAERKAYWIGVLKWPFTTAASLLTWYGKAAWQTQLILLVLHV